MGLPLWSSVGYGNDDQKPAAKSQPSAPRRSPIQRSFPTRGSTIVDPHTGSVRYVRRPVRRRGVALPLQVPVAQSEQSDSYQPTVRSPLVPSLGAIGDIITRAQRVLGHAHVEMDRLLARQYAPHLVTSAPTDRPLIDELDCLLRAARDFSENTREQITYLVRWERNLLRGEIIGPDVSEEFHNELEELIMDCEHNRGDIKRRLEEFQSWALDAREDISQRRTRQQDDSAATSSTRGPRPRTRFLNEAPSARPTGSQSRNVPSIRLRDVETSTADWDMATLAPAMLAGHIPDGLGDRLRSSSPEQEAAAAAAAAAWDTMRMTLEPDNRLPSTASSFTTAAASASFSAPSDRTGSTSAPLSAGSSRTDLSAASFEDEDCGPMDDGPAPSPPLPEVIPSPLFRDMSGRNGANDARSSRNNRRLPPPLYYGERPSRSTREHLTPHPHSGRQSQSSPRLPSSFMFSAPRSQSPLSFVTNTGVSTGPLAARESGPNTRAATPAAHLAPFDNDVSAVVRLAFQYASAVASSSDPHTDPEVEHMRRIFSTVAPPDGQLHENWWMSAGIAPYLADESAASGNNDSRNGDETAEDATR